MEQMSGREKLEYEVRRWPTTAVNALIQQEAALSAANARIAELTAQRDRLETVTKMALDAARHWREQAQQAQATYELWVKDAAFPKVEDSVELSPAGEEAVSGDELSADRSDGYVRENGDSGAEPAGVADSFEPIPDQSGSVFQRPGNDPASGQHVWPTPVQRPLESELEERLRRLIEEDPFR